MRVRARRIIRTAFVCIAVMLFGMGAAAQTTITWQVFQTAESYVNSIARRYEAENPGMRVQLVTGSTEEFIIRALGGSSPDVIMLNSEFAQLWVQGLLQDLSGYIARDGLSFEGVFPVAVDAFRRDTGETWALPVTIGVLAMQYNRQMFNESGVSPPVNRAWSHDEWLDMARKLTRMSATGDRVEVHGAGLNLTPSRVIGWLWQKGANVFNPEGTVSTVNTPEAIDFFEFLQRAAQSGAVINRNWVDRFANEEYAMAMDGPWRLQLLNDMSSFPIGVLHAPQDKAQVTRLVADGNAMSAFSGNKDAAWEFLKYLHSEEINQMWTTQTGSTSIWRSALPLQAAHYSYIDGIEVYLEAPIYGRVLETDFAGTTQWVDIFTKHLGRLWSGQVSPQETAIQMKSELDAYLQTVSLD